MSLSDRQRKRAAAAAIATALAIPAEGLRQFAYYDPPGILTVCYGHTGPDVMKNVRYSLTTCRSLLTKDMSEAVDAVDACHPNLPVSVLAAFSDTTFNAGPKIACDRKNSTAARLLDQKRYAEACAQLPRWNKARVMGVMVELPGLTKRRAAAYKICMEDLNVITKTATRTGGRHWLAGGDWLVVRHGFYQGRGDRAYPVQPA